MTVKVAVVAPGLKVRVPEAKLPVMPFWSVKARLSPAAHRSTSTSLTRLRASIIRGVFAPTG